MIKTFSVGLTVALLFSFAIAGAGARPQRDHLTDQESEQVRLNQELDKRIGVFIKFADRRFLVLTDPAGAAAKVSKKDLENFGPLPTGTRVQLLGDLVGILDEASDKIDDVAERDENNPLIKKALKKLSEAAVRFIAQLKAIGAGATNDEEKNAIERAGASAQLIIDAAKRVGV